MDYDDGGVDKPRIRLKINIGKWVLSGLEQPYPRKFSILDKNGPENSKKLRYYRNLIEGNGQK